MRGCTIALDNINMDCELPEPTFDLIDDTYLHIAPKEYRVWWTTKGRSPYESR